MIKLQTFASSMGAPKYIYSSLKPVLRKLMIVFVAVGLVATAVSATPVSASEGPIVRVKDISHFQGVRSNILIGYGIIVGLSGSGDSDSPLTSQTMANILERLGTNARAQINEMNRDNVAAVMVTSELPPFARQGSRIDVTVSSLGDASSLEGGPAACNASCCCRWQHLRCCSRFYYHWWFHC